ncbi:MULTISPECIES: hypothetical protein [unclassified Sphingobacterium]|uniref:hypothetical protein n=1 Tax=unclassified Sphingobacterium TaxID=2609468 RepID=UPI00104684EF|nr:MULTISPECIES: hypothetical protein [unclassified Sphingobacterium]MCS3556935.1 hypothetical protein [Sphingobacterium sp. JUb21]TCQ98939.1 hypothetical protein EDF66_11649 [Sphingobacterium sp. JUb20]
MAIIITYDIPSKHPEFKEKMFLLGYKESIPNNNCGTLYFPNTTLYHATKTATSAKDDAQSIATQLGITLDRCISTQIGPDWNGVCGKPFN